MDILPPSSISIEQCLISCCLMEPEIIQHLNAGLFYNKKSKTLYNLVADAKEIDIFDLYEKYEQAGEIGADVMQIQGMVPTSANWQMYANNLRELQIKRECIYSALDFINSVKKEEYDLTKLKERLDKIGEIQSTINNSIVDEFLNCRLNNIENIKNPEVIIEDLLCQGKIFCIGGASKAGKSLMACRIAMLLASGGEFFGRKCAQTKVLYFDTELDEDDFKQRQNVIKQSENLTVIIAKKIKKIAGELPLDKLTRYLGMIKNTAIREGYKAVFIDCIYKFINENEISEVSMLIHAVEDMKQAGITVVVIHHTKKARYEGGEVLSQLAGHSNLGRSIDGAMVLMECTTGRRSGEKHYQIYYSLRNFKIPAPIVVYIDSDTLQHVIDEEATAEINQKKESKKVKEDSHKEIILGFLPKRQTAPILKTDFVEYMCQALKYSEPYILKLCANWEALNYITFVNKGSKICTVKLGASLLGESIIDLHSRFDVEEFEDEF